MTQFNLFLELTGIINDLLEVGMTSYSVYDARMKIDRLFSEFCETEGVKLSELEKILVDTDIKELSMPPELKLYFQMIANFQTENEINTSALPQQFGDNTIEQVQLMVGFLDIVNNLLESGVTSLNLYDAHIKIDDLFKAFEEQEEAEEDRLRAELNNMPSDLEDMPINVDTFFNDLADHIGMPLSLGEANGETIST